MEQAKAVELVVAGGVVVTVDRARRVLADGAVAIDAGRIVAVGPTPEINAYYRPARRIDARDHIVMPGLVDAHVHITAETLTRGLALDDAGHRWMWNYALPLYAAVEEDEEYIGASLACLEMLRNGTTTFAEGGTARAIAASAQAVEDAGLRAILSPWTWDLMQEPANLRFSTDEALRRNADAIDAHHGKADGRIAVATSCVTPALCSPGLLKELKALADERRTTFTFHHASSVEPVDAYVARHGRRPLIDYAELGILGRNTRTTHMVHLDDAELAALAASGASVAHCPQTAFRLAYGAGRHGRFPEMLKRGIAVGLGTDGVNSSDNQDLFKAMQIAAGLFKDARQAPELMPAETVVEMATVIGARALGLEAEIGSLEAGKRADLILLDRRAPELTPLLDVANALVYAIDGRHVSTVIVGGREVMREREVLTLDADRLYAEVGAIAPRLIERAGLTPRPRWPIL
jgi:cytosine/adenosine deaminase-related metal-dependent hydrolase